MELDSFCDRDTTPNESSIANVGMESLLTSDLYAANPGKENFIGFSDDSTACDLDTWTAGAYNTTARPSANQLYTLAQSTTVTDAVKRMAVRLADASGSVPAAAQCELDVADYEMGVAGHISGDRFIGFSVNHNGVVDEETENTYANIKGTSGVCT